MLRLNPVLSKIARQPKAWAEPPALGRRDEQTAIAHVRDEMDLGAFQERPFNVQFFRSGPDSARNPPLRVPIISMT